MSGERLFIMISLAMIEFMHGFVLSFLGFITLRNVFFRETKKFLLFSFISGMFFSTVILSTFLFADDLMPQTAWSIELFILLIIVAGWFFLTERSGDLLVSMALAVVFAECIMINFQHIVFACMGLIIHEPLGGWMEILGYLLIYLLSFGFVFLLCKITGKKEREPLSKWNMLLLVGVIFVVVILIEVYYNLSESNSDVNPVAILPVSITFLFIVVVVILSVKSSQNRYYSKINQLSEAYIVAQAKHFEKVRESDIEMRRLRHDMKNHVLCMSELYRMEKYFELGEYLKQLSNTVIEIQDPIRTGNEIVDAIISEKSEEAKKDKIKLHVEGDFKEIHISAMDLCTILSNLLDNAIQATKELKETGKEIFVSARKTGNFFFLSVENITACNVEISDRIKTTKSNKKEHGFGIGNVGKTVKKCGGEFRLDCCKRGENYVFTAEVMVPLK